MRDLVVRRFLRHRLAVIGLIVLAVLIASALLAPAITQDRTPPRSRSGSWIRRGTTSSAPTRRGATSSPARCTGRISLTIGLAATLVALAIGTRLGAAAGYFGGPLDDAADAVDRCLPLLPSSSS